MTSAMIRKTKMIDEYITKLDIAIDRKDANTAKSLQYEIMAAYENEIEGLSRHLDSYSTNAFYGGNVDYLYDANMLRVKLMNYKLNLESGISYIHQSKDGNITVTQTVHQEVETKVTVTLDQTISAINELPSDTLSEEEKDILSGKLASLSAMKNKDSSTKWDKAKEILKWIMDKGVDVAIAALPYIIEILTGSGT